MGMDVVIVYNGFTFPNVYGPYKYSQSATNASLDFHTLLSEASSANLISKEASLLAACKEIKKDFSVIFNSASEFDLGNSKRGFVSRVTVDKDIREDYSTEITRSYKVSISWLMPYDQDNGKILAEWTMSKSESSQTSFSFHAEYSASSASPPISATAMSRADFFTWCDAIITAFKDSGESYERINTTTSSDIHDRRAEASALYKQILYDYSYIPLKIIDGFTRYVLSITPVTGMSFSGQTIFSCPKLSLGLSFTGFFQKLETTTQPVKDYKQYVKQQMLVDVRTILDSTTLNHSVPITFFVDKSSVNFNPSTYHFTGSIEIYAFLGKDACLFNSYEESVSLNFNENWRRSKLWDGKPYTYHSFSAGASASLHRTVSCSSFHLITYDLIPTLPPKFLAPAQEGTWNLEDHKVFMQKHYLGNTGDDSDIALTARQELVSMSVSEIYTFIDTANSVITLVQVVP